MMSILIMSVALSAQAAELYVAPGGDDADSGSKKKPLASLAGARNAVRKLIAADGGKLKEPVTVYFRGGTYRFKDTVVFGLEDSGSADAAITYTAYEDEIPVFSGGVPVTGWTQTKLRDGKVWSVEVPWVKNGNGFHALFDGGMLLQRARSPLFVNERVNERTKAGWGEKQTPMAVKHIKTREDSYSKVLTKETVLTDTRNLGDVEVFMRPEAKWLVNYLPLKSYKADEGVLQTTIEGTYNLLRDFYLENALEYLDEPGEWSLNTQEGKLYYWPESGKPGDQIEAPVLPALVRVEGKNVKAVEGDVPVRGLVFRGLTFSLCNRDVWTQDDIGIQHDWDMYDKDNALLRFRGAEDCVVDGCRFVNSGSGAVRVDLYGKRIRIENNTIRNVGGTGILLCGYGPGVKDVNNNNLILNNEIENCGTLYWHGLGVFVWQSGENRIAHNRIHDLGYMGMVISGVRVRFFGQGRWVKGRGDNPDRREYMKAIRWDETVKAGKDEDFVNNYQPYMHARNNLIEYNEIYNCMQRLTDGNCVYLSATGEGNVVRRNLAHTHVKNNMLRTDDDQYGTLVTENITIGNVSQFGYALKRVNTFENNILVHSMVSGQGAGGGPQNGALLKRNIYVQMNPNFRSFILDRMFKVLGKEDIDFNLYHTYGGDKGKQFLAKMQKKGWDQNSVAADPMFVDIQNFDFTMKPESPALKLGFKPIEGLETIGLLSEPAFARLRKAGGLEALMKVEAHPSEVFPD
jgi:hypothetical protein